ncbi:MAG: prepilin peptidase [Candidatus Levybacteria bacterium]|nr:prepilin peptidase [Candidatus Levybacteria bacterium]
MELLPAIFFGITGLFFGSFFLVIAQHAATGRSFVMGRSKCDFCSRVLSWSELIPVISFVLLRGKCKHCKKKLSLWYPISELITAFVFLSIALYVTSLFPMIVLSIIASCLLVIFFSDREFEIIPVQFVLLACLAELVMLLATPSLLLNHFLSGSGAAAFFYAIYLVTKKRGMGFGDVIFAFLMGFILGFPYIIFGLYLSFLSGACISLLLVALKKKKLHGGTVPFGPFLVFGTFIMMVWGEHIAYFISKYVGF